MENNAEIIKVIAATGREIHLDFNYKQLTSGHINKTYLLTNNGEQLVVQKLNSKIFTNLESISQNILNLGNHLKEKQFPYKILELVSFNTGDYLYEGKWRIFKFIDETQTFLKVQSATQAFEAAKFLSYFHSNLTDLALHHVQDSLAGFLDFEMRSQQYQKAIHNADTSRLENAKNAINYLQENHNILQEWMALLPKIPTRIIHADPKISNFLFDSKDPNKILALIDWDTFMLGSILYDFGDMVRSYTNLKEESDPETGNNFSLENYRAIEKGFLMYLKDTLTPIEIENLSLGAKVVIYIQAMRFLTDYLNNDVYYATQRAEQNLDRTKNQINLLIDLQGEIGDNG